VNHALGSLPQWLPVEHLRCATIRNYVAAIKVVRPKIRRGHQHPRHVLATAAYEMPRRRGSMLKATSHRNLMKSTPLRLGLQSCVRSRRRSPAMTNQPGRFFLRRLPRKSQEPIACSPVLPIQETCGNPRIPRCGGANYSGPTDARLRRHRPRAAGALVPRHRRRQPQSGWPVTCSLTRPI
jgi:hypothetical protein